MTSVRLAFAAASLALTLALPAPVFASRPYAERVREHRLANGMKLLLLEDHKAPVGVLQIWYRVGSRHERLGKTGLSHLLEHLMFKGTDKVGPEEHSRIIKRNGGNENAFTTEDSTTYFATLASDRLHVAIELEADRMHNLRIDDTHFAPELQVVMEERRLRTDNNPVAALFEQLKAVAFTAHPYQWPVIGWMNDLRLTTREDALAHYRTYYSPANAFAVAIGDFQAGDLLTIFEKHFGAVPTAPLPPPVYAMEPTQEGERRTTLRRAAQLPFVAIAYHVPNLRSRDAYALEVLSQILAGGRSARLHQDLVYQRRLARSAAAAYDLTSADPGLFYLYAQPMPGKSALQIERALLAHVKRLQRERVSERELQKARNGIEAAFVLAQDSFFYQAMLLGQHEIAGDWRKIDDYIPATRGVTAEDVQRVARFHLTADNRTVATLDPLPIPADQMVPVDVSGTTIP